MAAKVKWDRGAWWVITHYEGKRRKKRVGSTKAHKREAEQIAKKINAALVLGTFKPDQERENRLPCDAELRRWLTAYAPTMAASYEDLCRGLIERHLVPHFGSRDLREINEEDVLDYVRGKLEAGLSPKAIRNGLSILRRVYNLLQRDGRVGRNPAARIGELMRRVGRRLSEEVKITDSWTQAEVKALLSVAWEHERRFYPALATLFYTGLRRGELLGLKWSDVDFDRGRLHVRRAIVNRQVTTPKSGRGRYVSMAPPLASLLLELLGERRQATLARGWPETPDWLFCSQTGGFWDQDHFERSWRRVRRRAQKRGVRPLRLHCTRHTYATLALSSGKSLRWVADQLGHADPALTLRTYSHAIPDAEEDLSFLDFGGTGRPYTAPPSEAAENKKSGSGVTDRNRSRFLARPARLERAASRSATWAAYKLGRGCGNLRFLAVLCGGGGL